MKDHQTIGGIARGAGTGVETIRFYERQGLLALRVTAGKSCGDVRQRARQKITEIDHKIASLARMKRALETLAAACSGKGPVSACPILDALETREITA